MDNEKIYELIEDKEREIRSLQSKLYSHVSDIGDWKVVKCYEARIDNRELPYNWNELMASRQAARDRINELQAEIREIEYDMANGRCVYCHKALDSDGSCTNKKCEANK